MPFTISHVAAVLPMTRAKRLSLPLAALAAGSMAPDYLYFVPPLINYGELLHEPKYAFTFGIIAAFAAWTIWRVLAPGLYEIAPQWLRSRWDLQSWKQFPWWKNLMAFATGIATHLVLDSFTHSWGVGATRIGILSEGYVTPVGTLAGYELAQNLLSGLGLIILAIALVKTKPTQHKLSSTPKIQGLAVLLIPLSAVVGAVVRTGIVGGFDSRYEALAFYLLTGAVAGAALAALVLGLAAMGTRMSAR